MCFFYFSICKDYLGARSWLETVILFERSSSMKYFLLTDLLFGLFSLHYLYFHRIPYPEGRLLSRNSFFTGEVRFWVNLYRIFLNFCSTLYPLVIKIYFSFWLYFLYITSIFMEYFFLRAKLLLTLTYTNSLLSFCFIFFSIALHS